jgi:hypothetical protein
VAPWRVPPGTGTVVLVEGVSDQHALEAVADRAGRDLRAEGVAVVPMGGATNIGHYLAVFGPAGAGARLRGLVDASHEGAFRRALDRAGLSPAAGRGGLEQVGFFVCDLDLEDELIRALGGRAVERVIARQGELGSLRTLQNQPAHRGHPHREQLHRFLGTRSGRKQAYARLLVDALDPSSVPRPLAGLLAML